MIAGFIRAKQKRKAGMSGLLLFGLLALANIAAAEPAVIELVSATAGFDQRTNEPIVEYKLSPASGKLFAEATRKNVGRKLELRVDGQVVVSAVIREPILGGSGQISDRYTDQDVKNIVGRLSSRGARIEFEILD
jgi:preprotein translocase subunit SecD